jgi:malate dehydrogenase
MNCMIAASPRREAPLLEQTGLLYQVMAHYSPDQNRAQTQFREKKAGVDATAVKDIFIYGNHSSLMMFPGLHKCYTINGQPQAISIITGTAWPCGPFCDRRQARWRRDHQASAPASPPLNALVDHAVLCLWGRLARSTASPPSGARAAMASDANVSARMSVPDVHEHPAAP